MATAPAELRKKLSGLARLADAELRPAQALLLLAGLECPGCRPAPYLDYLARLADEVRTLAAGRETVDELAQALFEVIGQRHRFRFEPLPDDEDDADLNLMAVIDRRAGCELLAVVVLDVARAAGLDAHLLAFPARLLLRLEDCHGRRAILDPLVDGAMVEPHHMRALLKAQAGNAAELEPGHHSALGNRDLVVRLRNDAKLRLLRLGEVARALALVEATLLVAPSEAMLWREAGLMHLRLDDPCGAVAALEQFVARTPNAVARARTQALLADLKTRLT